MRFFRDTILFMVGLLLALFSVALARLGYGAFGLVQIPIIALVVTVFFFKESRLAALAAGLGLGLDAMSAYPYLTWTMILAATALFGWYLARTVFTNRSLPSLIMLGVAMRIAYFVFELAFSRAAEVFGGTVWYEASAIDPVRVLGAFGIELASLAFVFIIYVRSRGERSRMLSHL
jgi:hypothetical protein